MLLRVRQKLRVSCDELQQLFPVVAVQEYPRDLSLSSIRATVSRAYSITEFWLL